MRIKRRSKKKKKGMELRDKSVSGNGTNNSETLQDKGRSRIKEKL